MGNNQQASPESAYIFKTNDGATLLGEGQFGKVYKIHRKSDQLPCAAKIFKITCETLSKE
jgi:hypothetical protein